jgi:hypothetical protein
MKLKDIKPGTEFVIKDVVCIKLDKDYYKNPLSEISVEPYLSLEHGPAISWAYVADEVFQ